MSYESTLEYIHAVKWQGHKPGLSRTQELLSALGNPEQHLKFVHIAGTNGKGSTAACIASCLRQAGYRVGLYTSPYINRFNERIQVNGIQIPDDRLEEVVDTIRPVAERMQDVPTEFEVITAVAFLYFLQEQCDIVVLEVGLGGTTDSTNVIPAPECAVITALGLDHVQELGGTLASIASAKAGIIKTGSSVVSYGGQPETDAVIAAVCAQKHADLHTVDFSKLTDHGGSLHGQTFDFGDLSDLHLPLIGVYQQKNAATAVTALHVLRQKGWSVSDDAIRQGLAAVSWPGRFELLLEQPPFLLDGSHNAHGMTATVESIRRVFPGKKCTFLMSVMADKDVAEMLELLSPLAERVVTVTAHNPRAMAATELADRISRFGIPAVAADSIPAGVALARKLAGPDGITMALGTLYFSGDVRNCIEQLT